MPRNPLALGAALIVAGMAVIGFTDNLVRVIAEEVSVWQFHLVRTAMALPLLAAAAGFGLRLRPERAGRVAVRSGVQAAAMFLYFGSLAFMPIAQAGAGVFTAPLFVLMFSAGLFRQRIAPFGMLAVLVGFLGVLVVLRPDPARLEPAMLMPVAAGALYGLSNLLTREWCAGEPVAALVASFFLALGIAGGAVCLVLTLLPPANGGAPFLTRPWAWPSGVVLFWIAVQAVGSLAGVALLSRGYQAGATSVLAVFEYSFLVSATLWAWLIWGQRLTAVEAIGIALIIASGAMMARAVVPVRAQAASAGR
jgi:drug/metabolite transporter (DMT)-like permease